MPHRSLAQRWNLLTLAARITTRAKPLGVGMHNECWGAVAAGIARQKGDTATHYYGLTFRELRAAIKGNAEAAVRVRNRVMAKRTLRYVFER